MSDVKAFTCGSAPVSCYDPVRRTIYAPYLASRRGFGEQHEIVALSAIPVDRPDKATSKANAKKGVVKYKNKATVKNLVTSGKTVKLYAVWKKR